MKGRLSSRLTVLKHQWQCDGCFELCLGRSLISEIHASPSSERPAKKSSARRKNLHPFHAILVDAVLTGTTEERVICKVELELRVITHLISCRAIYFSHVSFICRYTHGCTVYRIKRLSSPPFPTISSNFSFSQLPTRTKNAFRAAHFHLIVRACRGRAGHLASRRRAGFLLSKRTPTRCFWN